MRPLGTASVAITATGRRQSQRGTRDEGAGERRRGSGMLEERRADAEVRRVAKGWGRGTGRRAAATGQGQARYMYND